MGTRPAGGGGVNDGTSGGGVNDGTGAGVTAGALGLVCGGGAGTAADGDPGGGASVVAVGGVSEITASWARAARWDTPDATTMHAEQTSQRPTAHINCIGPQWRRPCQAVTVHS